MINFKIVGCVMLFVLLIGIQYTLNGILRELREIKKVYKGNYDLFNKNIKK